MTDFSSCKGKVVIVTGGGSGMGKAMAKTFGANGMKVVVADMREDAAKAVADEINAQGGEAIAFQCDVSEKESVQAMVGCAVSTYGKLDGIVNNAGIGIPEQPAHLVATSDYEKVIAVDQLGVFYGIKYGAEAILNSKSEGGFIICTSSTGGFTGAEGMTAYVSAKHAVIGLVKTAALDYATRGITVNAICPGPVKTEIWAQAPQEYIDSYAQSVPIHRLIEPVEIANLALFLASDLARNITGAAIVADGGDSVGKVRSLEW